MIKQNQKSLNTVLILLDAVLCVLSMSAGYFIRFQILDGSTGIHFPYYMQLMAFVVPVYFLLYHYFDLHTSFRYKSLLTEMRQIIKANAAGGLYVFVLLFFLKQVHISRLAIFFFLLVNTALTSVSRVILRKTLRRLRKKGYNLKYLLLVGWNEVAAEFYDKIQANKNLGYKINGYINSKELPTGTRNIAYRGTFQVLEKLLNTKVIDEVIIALDYDQFSSLKDIIEACEKAGVKSSILPFYMKYLPTKPYIDEIEGLPLINIRKIPLDNFLSGFAKRSFDFAVSLCLLLLLSPVLLGVAIGVKLSSPGPVIYKQERVGKNKKLFTMFKFRSMAIQKDGSDMTTWGTAGDTRRTKFGEFIRKYSIDELPQLYNVLCGDMSLVGPRPERPFFVDKFKEEIPLYMLKHLVRPGITGWAQVNGWRGDTSIEQRIKCDIYYIENWNFLFDIKILFLTAFRGFVNKSEE